MNYQELTYLNRKLQKLSEKRLKEEARVRILKAFIVSFVTALIWNLFWVKGNR